MKKPIGTSFEHELRVAGLLGLPFSWGADGTFEFSDQITPHQKKQILSAYEAHDFKASQVSEAALNVRNIRDQLIAKTDWTQLADSPVKNLDAWKEYRQKLRDITKQKGFPQSVDWPVSP